MNFNHENFNTVSKANVETSFTLASTVMASLERIAALNLRTTRTLIEEAAANAKTLIDITETQELFSPYMAIVKPTLEKASAYSQSLYEIASETSKEVAEQIEAQYIEANKHIVSALDKVGKDAPPGSDAAMTIVRSAIATANAVYGSISKTAKKPVEISESNIPATRNATTKAAAAPKVKKAA
jgi:phasin family protein